MNSISITWNGHSCFTVEKDGFSIVFDPYGPNTVPGLAPLSLTADMILCSHEHGDHGYTDAVTLKHSGTKNHDKRMNDCLPPILFSAIFKLLKVLPDTELDAC